MHSLNGRGQSNIVNMNKTLSNRNNTYSRSLEKDFKIITEAKSIPMDVLNSNEGYGILGLCLEGNITFDVYYYEHRLSKGELLVILPGQTVALKDKSEDFLMNYFIVSQDLINDVLTGISRLSPLFFIHMRKKHQYQLIDSEIERFKSYFKLINARIKPVDHIFEREYILNVLRLFYLDLYNNYKNTLLLRKTTSDSNKENLAYNFFLLIMEHYRENREVAFYAEKLFITPKYLSRVIKEISGRSAKDWIVEYTILEIKSLLHDLSLNIQEIAIKTNFSNQASLGRFFRKHIGMSPSQYRFDISQL